MNFLTISNLLYFKKWIVKDCIHHGITPNKCNVRLLALQQSAFAIIFTSITKQLEIKLNVLRLDANVLTSTIYRFMGLKISDAAVSIPINSMMSIKDPVKVVLANHLHLLGFALVE